MPAYPTVAPVGGTPGSGTANTNLQRQQMHGGQFEQSGLQRGLHTGASAYAGMNALAAGKGLWGGMAMSYYNVPSLVLMKANPAQRKAQMQADANFVRHGREMEMAQGLPTLKRSMVDPIDGLRALVLLNVSHLSAVEASGQVTLTGGRAKTSSPLGMNVSVGAPALEEYDLTQRVIDRMFLKESARREFIPGAGDLSTFSTDGFGAGLDYDYGRQASPEAVFRAEQAKRRGGLPWVRENALPTRRPSIESKVGALFPSDELSRAEQEIVDEASTAGRALPRKGLQGSASHIVEAPSTVLKRSPAAKTLWDSAREMGSAAWKATKKPMGGVAKTLGAAGILAGGLVGADALIRGVTKAHNRRQEEPRFQAMLESIDLTPVLEGEGRRTGLTGQLAAEYMQDPEGVANRLRPGFSLLNQYSPSVAKDPALALEFSSRLARNEYSHISPEEYLRSVQEAMRLEDLMQSVQPGLADRVSGPLMPKL